MMWSREDTGIQIFVYEHTMPRLLKSRIALIYQGQVVRKVDNTIHCKTGKDDWQLTIDNCLTVTIDGSKRTNYWLRVFIANNITA